MEIDLIEFEYDINSSGAPKLFLDKSKLETQLKWFQPLCEHGVLDELQFYLIYNKILKFGGGVFFNTFN